MKKEQLSDALDLLNDDILEETSILRSRRKQAKKNWWKWTLAAACLALVVSAGIWTLPRETPGGSIEPGSTADLPMLSVTEDTNVGAGFEGYLVYDISELVSGNPWKETLALSTLPVYKNPLALDAYFIAPGADVTQMRETLLEVAGRLKLDTAALSITEAALDEGWKQFIIQEKDGDIPEGYFHPSRLIAKTEDLKIEVDQTMTAGITFAPSVPLPSEYHFATFASYEDMRAAAEYLEIAYKDLINMENPQISIKGGDYDVNLQRLYLLSFFDASGGITEQIVNYNLRQITFYGDSDGKLWGADIHQPDLSEKAGDYPIITVEQARELLANGNYITSVPYEMPGMEYAAKVELIYRSGPLEEYFMPYYRFYVELPEEARDGGLKTYGAYYVPAVESTYISNMPMWDGRFNS